MFHVYRNGYVTVTVTCRLLMEPSPRGTSLEELQCFQTGEPLTWSVLAPGGLEASLGVLGASASGSCIENGV